MSVCEKVGDGDLASALTLVSVPAMRNRFFGFVPETLQRGTYQHDSGANSYALTERSAKELILPRCMDNKRYNITNARSGKSSSHSCNSSQSPHCPYHHDRSPTQRFTIFRLVNIPSFRSQTRFSCHASSLRLFHHNSST